MSHRKSLKQDASGTSVSIQRKNLRYLQSLVSPLDTADSSATSGLVANAWGPFLLRCNEPGGLGSIVEAHAEEGRIRRGFLVLKWPPALSFYEQPETNQDKQKDNTYLPMTQTHVPAPGSEYLPFPHLSQEFAAWDNLDVIVGTDEH